MEPSTVDRLELLPQLRANLEWAEREALRNPVPGTFESFVRPPDVEHYREVLTEFEDEDPEPGPKPIPHGSDSGYRRHKCRCAPCTEAHRQARRKERGSDAGDRIREGRRYLTELGETSPGLDEIRPDLTVGDVVKARSPGQPCFFARPHLLRNRNEKQIRFIVFRCMQGRCTQCADRWAYRALKRWCRVWGDADVWSVELTPEEWKCAPGRRIRGEYGGEEKRYAGVWLRERERLLVFVPGEVDGGEPVRNVGVTVMAALLATPAHPKDENRKGRNRTFGIPISVRSVSEWESVLKGRLSRLKRDQLSELADQLQAATGKNFLPDEDNWTVANFSSSLRELTEEEFERADAVLTAYAADLARWDALADELTPECFWTEKFAA